MLALGLFYSLTAGEIRGVITVKRQLTKRVAAPLLDTYERGVAVPIAVEDEGPLVYERTHTVVYVEGDFPATRSITKGMQQENRAFGPDLVVVPAGSSVSFPNMDPIFHNVFSLSKTKSFDLGNYSKGQTRTVTFSRAGIVLVNCRLHTNMSAVIVVTPSRFYASPDEKGRFAIPDVPAGRYTVAAWHKAAGFLRKEVTVVEGVPSSVDFLVPLTGPDEPRLSAARR
jgi:plastocyanin